MSVGVCMLVTRVDCAQMDEPIVSRGAEGESGVGRMKHVLDRAHTVRPIHESAAKRLVGSNN